MPPKPTLRDSVANLSEEVAAKDRVIDDLKSRVAELEEELAAARKRISELETIDDGAGSTVTQRVRSVQ